MAILAWIAEFIGRILKHILPGLIKEWKKPRTTIQVGGDKDVKKDIDDDISDSISNSTVGLPPQD